MSDASNRLTDIEIALTHQQAMLDDLSGVVRDQAGRIERLEALAARLAQRLEAAEAALPEAGEDPDRPPPHW